MTFQISPSTVANFTYGAVQFTAESIPNFNELAALFDSYKISGVRVLFKPHWNTQVWGTSAAPIDNGRFYVLPSYDANASYATESAFQQTGATPIYWLNQMGKKMYIKPRFVSKVYESAEQEGFAPRRGWIDSNDTAVPHYGLQYGWFGFNTPTGDGSYFPPIDVFVTYYVKMRGLQ